MNTQGCCKPTSLHRTSEDRDGHVGVARVLLDCEVDTNTQDSVGQNPQCYNPNVNKIEGLYGEKYKA